MRFSFIAGLVLAILVIIFGIAFDPNAADSTFSGLSGFIDMPGILIITGGTFATLIACFPFSLFIGIPAHFGVAMRKDKYDPAQCVNVMSKLAEEAGRKGLLALVDSVSKSNDSFLTAAVMAAVDAVEPAGLRGQFENELSGIDNRHAQVWDFYDKGAALSLCFGMAGTLIALVKTLRDIMPDGENSVYILAQGMATALSATLFGILLANLLFVPLASRLRTAHRREMFYKKIIIEGMLSIQSGENSRSIREKLISYLNEGSRPARVIGSKRYY